MKSMPFPKQSEPIIAKSSANDSVKLPWTRANHHEQLPLMLQIERSNGNVLRYAYCDIREIRLLNSGYLQLLIFGMEKYCITIEGRHLDELADQLGNAKIKSMVEYGPRTFHEPETSPAIDKITIEELTGTD